MRRHLLLTLFRCGHSIGFSSKAHLVYLSLEKPNSENEIKRRGKIFGWKEKRVGLDRKKCRWQKNESQTKSSTKDKINKHAGKSTFVVGPQLTTNHNLTFDGFDTKRVDEIRLKKNWLPSRKEEKKLYLVSHRTAGRTKREWRGREVKREREREREKRGGWQSGVFMNEKGKNKHKSNCAIVSSCVRSFLRLTNKFKIKLNYISWLSSCNLLLQPIAKLIMT